MENEKRLIDANELNTKLNGIIENRKKAGLQYQVLKVAYIAVADCDTVDAVEVVQSRVGDTIFEVDPEHGVVKHEVYEVCVVYKTTATDDNGMVWDDFYTSDDIDTAYKTRQEAEANFCSYGERREGE